MAEEERPRVAILDKNPHVRELLCREFAGRDLTARALRNGAELVRLLDSGQPPQVVVLDPEALGAGDDILRSRLAAQTQAGRLAVVLHVFADAENSQAMAGLPQALVAARQPNLGSLNAAVDKALRAVMRADRNGKERA